MVKVLEVFIRKATWITGDKHRGTNTTIKQVFDYFSRTVNIVTKKTKKWPCADFFGSLIESSPAQCMWFVAAFFGATTLEIVVARANQPPRLFLACLG
jgi:hypothetical protein